MAMVGIKPIIPHVSLVSAAVVGGWLELYDLQHVSCLMGHRVTIAVTLAGFLLSMSARAAEMSHSLSIVFANWPHNTQQEHGSK